MKFAEIYKIQNDGSQKVIATCKMVGKEAACQGDRSFIENLKRDGIPDYSKQLKMLFPRDGLIFLKCLKLAFRSGYLTASDVKEKSTIRN